MASYREHCGIDLEDWGMLRVLARCADAMGYGEMDVLAVVLRDHILPDLKIEEQKCPEK